MRLVRIFLACLLMAAVPLQGFAAASMALCGAPGTAAPTHTGDGHDHDHGLDHGVHSHDATGDEPAAHACSVCMACCHSVAVSHTTMAAGAPLPSQAPAEATTSFLRDPPPSFLERPPRA